MTHACELSHGVLPRSAPPACVCASLCHAATSVPACLPARSSSLPLTAAVAAAAAMPSLACFLLLAACWCLAVARRPQPPPPPPISPMDVLHAVHSGGAFRPGNHSRSPAAGIGLLSEGVEEEEKEEEEDEEITLSSGHDCRTARAAAEASRRNHGAGGKMYLPSCSPDGRYEETQCYEDFCWCVDTVKGIPMKGSGSSRNTTRPDCSRKKAVSRFRDCHMEQKLHFLKLLTALFRQQMMQAKNWRQAGRRSRSKGRILRWKFDRLDLDRNGVLDSKEWKLFKQSLKGSKKKRTRQTAPYNDQNFKSVRHCFRLFFRGCDLNSDRNVIREEWLECTGSSVDTEDGDTVLSMSSLAASHFRGRRQRLRKGPNPFATILKAD